MVQAFYAFTYCLKNVKLNNVRDTFNGITKFSKVDIGFDILIISLAMKARQSGYRAS